MTELLAQRAERAGLTGRASRWNIASRGTV
jgi:hypothetical protein